MHISSPSNHHRRGRSVNNLLGMVDGWEQRQGPHIGLAIGGGAGRQERLLDQRDAPSPSRDERPHLWPPPPPDGMGWEKTVVRCCIQLHDLTGSQDRQDVVAMRFDFPNVARLFVRVAGSSGSESGSSFNRVSFVGICMHAVRRECDALSQTSSNQRHAVAKSFVRGVLTVAGGTSKTKQKVFNKESFHRAPGSSSARIHIDMRYICTGEKQSRVSFQGAQPGAVGSGA
ncbi:hypothetical protein B7494_g6607 [Chlorociboria aeruginascens]|nr:hypothetical protein B7494_g6607 [Chlorociboria aeruginascens]